MVFDDSLGHREIIRLDESAAKESAALNALHFFTFHAQLVANEEMHFFERRFFWYFRVVDAKGILAPIHGGHGIATTRGNVRYNLAMHCFILRP